MKRNLFMAGLTILMAAFVSRPGTAQAQNKNTTLLITIKDNTADIGKYKKVRFDYVLSSASTNKTVKLGVYEFLMSEYKQSGMVLNAPEGMYFEPEIHFQLRCKNPSWHNDVLGLLDVSNTTRIELTFGGSHLSNQHVSLSGSNPQLQRNGFTTEAWIEQQTAALGSVSKTGNPADGKYRAVNKPAASDYEGKFTHDGKISQKDAHSKSPRGMLKKSLLTDCTVLYISNFIRDDNVDVEITSYVDFFDKSSREWYDYSERTVVIKGGTCGSYITYSGNANSLVYCQPYIRIRTRSTKNGVSEWKTILDDQFDFSKIPATITLARLCLYGTNADDVKVVNWPAPNAVTPMHTPDRIQAVESITKPTKEYTTDTETHTVAPKHGVSTSNLAETNSIMVLANYANMFMEVEVTLYLDVYDRYTKKWVCHRNMSWTLNRGNRAIGYTFFVADADSELLYSKPFVRIRTKAGSNYAWKTVFDDQIDIKTDYKFGIIAFKLNPLDQKVSFYTKDYSKDFLVPVVK